MTVFAVILLPAWLAVLLAPNRGAARRITTAMAQALLAIAGCRVQVEGLEHLKEPGPRVLVSNHTSYFDAVLLVATLGVDYRFVSKAEVRSLPFIGTFLRKLGHFWFDRKVMTVPFLALLDNTVQWIFNKSMLYAMNETAGHAMHLSKARGEENSVDGQYLQLVISASYDLVSRGRQEIIDLCLR